MGKSKVIGAIVFAPSPDGTTQETVKIGPFTMMSDEGTKRLLEVMAAAMKPRNLTVAAEDGAGVELNAPLIDPMPDFSGSTIQVLPTRAGGHQEMRKYDVYHLVGEDMESLARNIKSYAFAYALALRWSQDLGQTVKLMRRTKVDAASGAEESECIEVVDARDTAEGAYITQQIRAEIGRIQNAKIAMREVADDVRCMIEDADDAISSLRALADIRGIPPEMIAQTARATADHFDTLHWYTLINHADTEMIGELLATDAA